MSDVHKADRIGVFSSSSNATNDGKLVKRSISLGRGDTIGDLTQSHTNMSSMLPTKNNAKGGSAEQGAVVFGCLLITLLQYTDT